MHRKPTLLFPRILNPRRATNPIRNSRRSEDRRRDRSGSQGQSSAQPQQPQQNGSTLPATAPLVGPAPPAKERRPSQSGFKPLPPSPPTVAPSSYRPPTAVVAPPTPKTATPGSATPTRGPRPAELNGNKTPVTAEPLVVNVSSPPATPNTAAIEQHERDKDSAKDTGSQNSVSSAKKGHSRGKSSLDRIGLGKIFGSGFGTNVSTAAAPVTTAVNGDGTIASQHSITPVPSEGQGSATSVLLSPVANEKDSGKKSRRNTLTVMVEPFSRSIRNRKGRMASTPLTADGPSAAKETKRSPQAQSAVLPPTKVAPATADTSLSPSNEFGDLTGMHASSNKAKKVMQWFRTKSKGRDSVGYGMEEDSASREKESGTPTQTKYRKGFSASSSRCYVTAASRGRYFGSKEGGRRQCFM
ncbi:hypothetical protein NLJ89_g6448 [Agrocybe chaxingu]|uniref:Uncharacterized protein n=1 Tax=Agrocybe chaxingu TaxID=84603 RepID=A0A9W8JYR5_9AGAR|nr:hypothetical protein NLJ89_g6448 [Agrocybe chaxingu]